MAKTNKPILIATGASNIHEVEKIYKKTIKINQKLILMQCNTNYTNSIENFNHINLNVLKLFKKKFKDVILGLSDHTSGYETVLGAIALGARVIEKHFTDSNLRNGPDHKFSMNPKSWKEMIKASRILEKAMGNEIKKVELNEQETVILQRRSIRAKNFIKKNQIIKKKDFEFLRPCPKDALPIYDFDKILNKKSKFSIIKGDYIRNKFR
jgi:N-acetylneuraminate synthase